MTIARHAANNQVPVSAFNHAVQRTSQSASLNSQIANKHSVPLTPQVLNPLALYDHRCLKPCENVIYIGDVGEEPHSIERIVVLQLGCR